MSTFTAYCPHCGQKMNYRQQSIGTMTRCKRCGRNFELGWFGAASGKGSSCSNLIGCGVLVVVGLMVLGWIGGKKGDKPPAGQPAPQAAPVSVQQPERAIQDNSTNEAASLPLTNRKQEPDAQDEEQQRRTRERLAQEQERARIQAEKEENARLDAEAKQRAQIAAENERAARTLLKMAKTFLDDKRPEFARTRLQTLLEKYPDTKSAIEARKLLADMGS